jgi:C-1 hydroxylase
MKKVIISLLCLCISATTYAQTPAQNKAIYLKANAGFNERRFDEGANYYTPNHHDLTDPTRKTSIKEGWENWIKIFPDMQVKVLEIVAEGDLVMARHEITATHTNEYMGVKPTGKKLKTQYWTMSRANNEGKIFEGASLVDNAAVMAQLGLLK